MIRCSVGLLSRKMWVQNLLSLISVAEPEPPGVAAFRVELEPIFLLVRAEKAALVTSSRQSKKKSLVLVSNITGTEE